MTESLQRAEGNTAPELEAHDEPTLRSAGWTRWHTIWTSSSSACFQGVLIAAFRNHWEDLPAGVQLATYLTCAILIAAAVTLIIAPRSGDA